MKIIAVTELPTKAARELSSNRGFAAARDAHKYPHHFLRLI
jgi:hypothetical protein